MKKGYCYVAWGEQYIKEATISQQTCDYPTCLFTDKVTTVPDNVFTYVIRSDFKQFEGLHFFYRKLIALQESPFDLTCYLDSDTRLVNNVKLGFDKANEFDFATVIAPGQIFQWYEKEFIHYNAGVLWFKGYPKLFVDEVLKLAKTFTLCDEPAWSLAWDELKINPAVLPSVYNLITTGPIHDRPVRIWHSRDTLQHFLVYPN